MSLAEPGDTDEERRQWLALSSESLAAAYGESEPEYTADMIREPNRELQG